MHRLFKHLNRSDERDTLFHSLCWVVFMLAIVALFVSIATDTIDRSHFYNSDALSVPAIYEDIVLGYSLRGWHFGPAPSFFPDMLLYAGIRFLTGNVHLAMMGYGLVQFLLFLLGFLLLSRQLFGRNNPVHGPLLLIGTALALVLSTGEATALLPVLLNSFHFGACVVLVFALTVVIAIMQVQTNTYASSAWLSGLLWLLSTLTLASDAIYLIQFLLPLWAVLLVLLLCYRISTRSALFIYGPTALSVLVVPALNQRLLIYRGGQNTDSGSDLTLHAIIHNSAQTISEFGKWAQDRWFSPTLLLVMQVIWLLFILSSLAFILFRIRHALRSRPRPLFQAAHAGTIAILAGSMLTIVAFSLEILPITIAGIGLILAALMLSWRSVNNPIAVATPDTGQLAVVLCFLFSSVANIAAAMFVGVGLPRYFLPTILIPVFFGWPFLIAGCPWGQTAIRQRCFRYGLSGIILVLFLMTGTVARLENIAALRELRDYYPPFAQCIDQGAALNNLHYGLTQYWDAKYLSLLSRRQLRFVQVRHSLHKGIVVEHFINNLNWYNANADFVITEDQQTGLRAIQSTKIIQQFGEPANQFVCYDRNGVERKIFVYNRLEDRAFQQQYLTHFLKHFPAAELPSQIGEIVGTSRQIHNGHPGYLTYGPYVELFIGDYLFELQYESSLQQSSPIAEWDVFLHPAETSPSAETSSPKILAKWAITEQGNHLVTGNFSIREQGKIEIRTFYKGSGTFKVNSLLIKRKG